MVARGHVRNGVVVLDDGVKLTEGQEVTVISRTVDATSHRQSILDIPTVSVGRILVSLDDDADILGEMLDRRE